MCFWLTYSAILTFETHLTHVFLPLKLRTNTMDYFKQLMGIAVIVCPVAIALASICIKKTFKKS